MKNILNLTLVLALTAGASNAEITVLDSATGLDNAWTGNGPASLSFTGLDLTGGSKLVVSIGTQGTQSATAWSSVTFDGVAMTEAARRGDGPGYQSGIYYLDNLTGLNAGGDLEISATIVNSRGVTATAWVLGGTAAGVGATGASDGASTSLTTTAADSWVLAHATVAGTTVPVAQSPLTAGPGVTNPYNGSSQTSIATGYQTVALSGTSLTPTFDIGTTTVAAAFAPSGIPAPSPLAVTDFVYNPGANTFDLSLEGAANSAYILVEAADLDFSNPDQSPIPLDGATATVGSLDTVNDTLTTDGSGNATVTGVSLGAGAAKDATFLRAETAP